MKSEVHSCLLLWTKDVSHVLEDSVSGKRYRPLPKRQPLAEILHPTGRTDVDSLGTTLADVHMVIIPLRELKVIFRRSR